MTIFGWVFAVILMLAGLAGTVLPGLPGTLLVFAGLFLAAWMDHFSRVGFELLLVLGGLSGLSYFLDALAVSFSVKRVQASREAVIGAVIGSLIGLFMGIVGLTVMPFLGAAAGEFYARRNLGQAGKVGLAAWLGLVFGTLARLALAFLMIGLFILGYLWPS